MNLPALKKLDALLLGILGGVLCHTEFWYVDRGIVLGDLNECNEFLPGGRPSIRQEDKWWLPCPKVPADGCLMMPERGCSNAGIVLIKYSKQPWLSIVMFLQKWKFLQLIWKPCPRYSFFFDSFAPESSLILITI
ncbi:Rop guanine nucleotide exchange factor 1, partial [Cucurbita argyrosperma subsp. sororia]